MNVSVIENSRHADPAEASQDRVYLFLLSWLQLHRTRHLASNTLQFGIAHCTSPGPIRRPMRMRRERGGAGKKLSTDPNGMWLWVSNIH